MARNTPWLAEHWHRHDDFMVVSTGQQEQLCPPAQHFATWGERTVQTVLSNPTPISINQCKILVLDKYFAFRSNVPKAHQERLSERLTHICIFQVFERLYMRLRLEELAMTPPLLFEPVQPQITNITNITKYDGFQIGETVIEDDE